MHEQAYRKSDAHGERPDRSFGFAAVLDQEIEAKAKADDDPDHDHNNEEIEHRILKMPRRQRRHMESGTISDVKNSGNQTEG